MNQELSFTIKGLEDLKFYAESLSGREALSETYAFVVDVIARKPVDIEAVIGKPATITIKVAEEEAVINGIVSTAMATDPTASRDFCFRFTVEPEVSLMRLSGQNQVYSTETSVTVMDIVEKELSDANKAGSKTAGSRPSRTMNYEVLLDSASYPKLDFVMQYGESDFDFISRLCEKFGIFYMFDTSGSKETLLFCDRKEHFRKVDGRTVGLDLPFRGEMQTLSQGELAIRSFHAVCRAQTATVAMREYNDETPTVDLGVSHSAGFQGFGTRVDYGQNYRNPAEGRQLAQKRTELLETERLQYHGQSDIPNLRPGVFFKLVDHPDAALEKIYVVTEVQHDLTESTPFGFSSARRQSQPYRNRFTCIPFDTQYRPPLKTPKPVIHGMLLGIVDGEINNGRAELDKYGRYRVRILDEESGLANGKASHFLRKVEPYGGGDGFGSHSTLLIGTEVMLAFLHGDPDRPVIVGAFSNAEQSNTVTSANFSVAHRMRTASGAIFQISDGNP